jgi:hypothetical protein
VPELPLPLPFWPGLNPPVICSCTVAPAVTSDAATSAC